MKKEIISKHESCFYVFNLAKEYDMAKLMTCTILKKKDSSIIAVTSILHIYYPKNKSTTSINKICLLKTGQININLKIIQVTICSCCV